MKLERVSIVEKEGFGEDLDERSLENIVNMLLL